ncbi:MAG: YncE family protein [Deltaproteobacteria bacterium]|nr:YncE family protein [Deltaproteobacteria bacterium]
MGFGICLLGCASENDIFPPANTSLDPADLELPNPIAIAVDPANSQIIVVNSNVDFFFEEGTLATLSVDATDPNAPVLTATAMVASPSFGGQIAFDGTEAYIPFRESPDDSDNDQVKKFTIGNGSIAETATGTTGENPFGIALSGSSVLVVSDDQLDIFNTDLASTAAVDLTVAEEADIDDADSSYVEHVAVDTATNRAFITNRLGKILVVDLDTNTVSHVIAGSLSSRGIAGDGTLLYIVDGDPPALWVYDPGRLTDPDTAPEEVDDSELVVAIIDLGESPNGIAVDTANGRAYVANSDDRSVSVVDLTLFEEIDRISLKDDDTGFDEGKDPFGLAVGTFGGADLVFVANFSSNTIAVINADTLEVVASFP